MPIDLSNASVPWTPMFLPPADRVTYSASLGDADYAARSGAPHIRGAWASVRTAGNVFVSVGAAAPADDSGSVYVRTNAPFCTFVPPGHQVWVKQVGRTAVAGSCEVWLHGLTE